MCAWGAAAAAAWKIGSSIYNNISSAKSAKQAAAANYAYNIASMNHQYKLTRELNKNAYQDTTYSMREAGINPMLAITNGVNNLSAGSGVNGTQNPTQYDLDREAVSSAISLYNQSKTTDSNVALNKSTELQQKANSANLDEQTKAQSIANKFAEEKNREEINLLKAQQTNQLQQGQSALVTAQNNTRMTNSNISLNSAKTVEANANAHSHPYKDLSEHVLKPIKNNLSNYYKSNLQGQTAPQAWTNIVNSAISFSKRNNPN